MDNCLEKRKRRKLTKVFALLVGQVESPGGRGGGRGQAGNGEGSSGLEVYVHLKAGLLL